jgi:uncharacterized membrane protein YdjX (TVP38/TMEM64 family)
MENAKKIMLYVWLALIAAGVVLAMIHPEWFTRDAIFEFVKAYEGQMLLVYLLICVGRGMFLIPSTPFVLAGGLLFHDNLWLVFAISMVGVLSGSAFIYYFTEFLGVDKIIQKRFAHKLEKTKAGMEKYGFWIVVAWSFFPLVPTDLIAYVAGITRMKPWKFFLGVFLGELPIVALYVFTGMALEHLIS